MTWGEAVRLTSILVADPSSQVAAAVSGWEHSFPWEAIVLADLFDVQMAKAAGKSQTPWPRPWKSKDRQALGRAMSREEFERVYRATVKPVGG